MKSSASSPALLFGSPAESVEKPLPSAKSTGFLSAVANGFMRLAGAFMQSTDPAQIGWKVRKYECQILQLRRKIVESFPEISEDKELEENCRVIKTLYDILHSIQVDADDPNRFTQAYLEGLRQVHNTKFHKALRESLLKAPDNIHLHKLCALLHTELNLDTVIHETLRYFDAQGAAFLEESGEENKTSPITVRLQQLFQRIHSVPYSAKAPLQSQWGNSACGQWNRGFDPGGQGNPRHKMYRLVVGDRGIKALGMGSPTVEDLQSNGSLAPEFIGFGKYYKQEGLKHLFVLNQNSIPKTGIVSYVINGDETKRCSLILEAQDREDLRGAIYAIALSKNSPFYYQEGKYAEINDAEAFKKELWEQVFVKPREESGCYIPKTIREEIPEFENIVRDVLIPGIHTHLFEGKKVLTDEERKLFIEQFYDHLTKLILSKIEFHTFNISCKDAIDRAAASNAQLYASSVITSNQKGEISAEHQKMIFQLMMVRALFVRKRPPRHDRVARFADGLEFMLANKEKLQNLHLVLFDQLQVVPERID